MSAKKARIPVTLEPVLYEWIIEEAKRQGISISHAVRDAVKVAYEWAATFEILSDKNMMKQIEKSRKSSKKDYVPFDEVKRNVYSRSK